MDTRMLEQIWPLMEEAFPPHERRTFAQHARIMSNPRYRLELVHADGAVAGFIGYWLLDDWVYVEHIAVSPALRQSGAGSRALADVIRRGLPVVVEVEIPPPGAEACLERRRIGLYERLGFILQPYAYSQPAYDGSGLFFPLHVMVYGAGVLPEDRFESLRAALYTDVYGIAP